MKKFIAITASTVLLSLFGASGLNLNTNLIVQAASTNCTTAIFGNHATCTTTNCNTMGKALVYKNINLSNCKNTTEVVKKLKASGLKKVTTKNIKYNKELKAILSQIKNKNSCVSDRCKSQNASCATNNVVKGTNTTLTKKANATKAATTPKKTTTTKTTKVPKSTPTTAPKTTTLKTTTAPKTTTTKTTTAPKSTPTTAPKTTTTTPVTTTNNSSTASFANQVLQLVNQERAKAGLSALSTNTTLTSAANQRAKETVTSFSHTRPNGTSFSTVLKEFSISYNAAGENIAYGQKTPQEVVTGWMNSPGHRANIMNANFGKIGIGVHKASNGTIYWTQVFTN